MRFIRLYHMARKATKKAAVATTVEIVAPALTTHTRESLAAFNIAWRAQRWVYWHNPESNGVTAQCEPLSVNEAFHALGQYTMPDYCHGRGYKQIMSDVWEDCSGCGGCDSLDILKDARCDAYRRDRIIKRHVGMALGVFFWRAAHLRVHTPVAQALAGLAGLVQIGRAVAAAGSLGAAINGFITKGQQAWQRVEEGRWYQVVGGRGRAKQFVGFIGQATKLYADATYGTACVKLVSTSGQPCSVPCGQVAAVPVPATIDPTQTPVAKIETAKAVQALRPVYMGRTGETGYVYSGPLSGVMGRVFWFAPDRGRVGIKQCEHTTRCTCKALFCDVRDIVPARTTVASALLGDNPVEISELIATMLYAVGFVEIAEGWMKVAHEFAKAGRAA